VSWCEVEPTYTPAVEAVWLDKYLITAALKAAHSAGPPPLIWYSHRAVAQELARGGLEVCPPGEYPRGPARPLAVSVASHGTGVNLQQWARSFVLCPPSGPAALEQLIGRTHRPGQESDEVWVWLGAQVPYLRGAWVETSRRAAALGELTGQFFRVAPGNHTWVQKGA